MPTTLEEHGNNFGLSLLGDYWRRPIPPDYRVARNTTLDRLSRDDARRAFARFVPESGRAVREAVQWWSDHSMASQAATTVRRVISRFPKGQAHFHEFAEMSHWLVGEPEAAEVSSLVLQWFEAREILPKPTKKKKPLSLFGWAERAGV